MRYVKMFPDAYANLGKHHAAIPYKTTARKISTVKPNCIAIRVASIALITEAQPLMPQAQGIKAGAVWLMLASAIGNGMPMQKPSGAIKMIENR